MDRQATAKAIFADICSEFAATNDALPQTVVAIREMEAVLWVTVPSHPPPATARLLGLAAPIAQADSLVYFADSKVAVDDEGRQDALVCVEVTLNSDRATGQWLAARPYVEQIKRFRRTRQLGELVEFGPESAMFGDLLSDLSSSAKLSGDPKARIAATQALIGNNFDLSFSDELDDELTQLIDALNR